MISHTHDLCSLHNERQTAWGTCTYRQTAQLEVFHACLVARSWAFICRKDELQALKRQQGNQAALEAEVERLR